MTQSKGLMYPLFTQKSCPNRHFIIRQLVHEIFEKGILGLNEMCYRISQHFVSTAANSPSCSKTRNRNVSCLKNCTNGHTQDQRKLDGRSIRGGNLGTVSNQFYAHIRIEQVRARNSSISSGSLCFCSWFFHGLPCRVRRLCNPRATTRQGDQTFVSDGWESDRIDHTMTLQCYSERVGKKIMEGREEEEDPLQLDFLFSQLNF